MKSGMVGCDTELSVCDQTGATGSVRKQTNKQKVSLIHLKLPQEPMVEGSSVKELLETFMRCRAWMSPRLLGREMSLFESSSRTSIHVIRPNSAGSLRSRLLESLNNRTPDNQYMSPYESKKAK